MGVVERPKRLDPRKVIGALLLAAMGLVLVLIHYSAYLQGPGTHDLTPEQRTGVLKSALKRGGIAVLRERGGIDTMQRDDVADVGRSRCIGEQECVRWSRRRRDFFESCAEVQANLYCAFELTDPDGSTAAALIKTTRSRYHTPPDLSRNDPDWRYEMMQTERPDTRIVRTKLCDMGYCEPGALTRWKRPKKVEPPDPHAEARRQCKGVLAEIAGKGMTCLDPGNPEAREFRDCKDGFCGPVMVALPKGRYVRGTSDAEAEQVIAEFPGSKDWVNATRPAHEVTIGRHVAIGRFELTFEEWEQCRQHGRCTMVDSPHDQGWGRGKRPVINVSWEDITRHYLPWLNARLGLSGAQAYRLPSDGEWEYAARAGTASRYAFGDTITATQARFAESSGGPLPVGSFAPNAFGLHDLHGNVQEWVEDCYSLMNDPKDLPTDGSPLRTGMCSMHAFRGGSFSGDASFVRSASRSYNYANARMPGVGLRLARSLEPPAPEPRRRP